MKNLSIKNKILALVSIAIILTFLVSIIITTIESKKLADNQRNEFLSSMMGNAKEALNAYTQVAETSIKQYLSKSTKSAIEKEIQKDSSEAKNLVNRIYAKNPLLSNKDIKEILVPLIGKEKKVEFFQGKNLVNESISEVNPRTNINDEKIISTFYFEPLNLSISIKAFLSDVQLKYKNQAAKVLSDLRFLGNGYFYGVELKKDGSAYYVVDGSKFKRFGKQWDLTHKDKKGRAYRKQIIDNIQKSSNGITYVPYVFFNPKTQQLNEKLAIGKLFKQWNWIIISGIYLTDINAKVDNSHDATVVSINSMITYVTITAAIIAILILLVIAFVVSRYVKREFSAFEDGLISFFRFLNKESDDVTLLSNESKDEIGYMSGIINENISKAKINLEKNHQFLLEVQDIVADIRQGHLSKRLNNKMDDEGLEELRVNFNEMLDTLSQNVGKDTNVILEVLEKLAQNDFTNKIDDNLGGGKISTAINQVIELINNMLRDNKQDGINLQDSSNSLLKYVDNLNHSSNTAAASLEETSAAVEEITSNIRGNTDNIIKMSGFASSLQDSANNGKDLASKTAFSMDEINEEVTSINEAITVIDQIAFQTNILSLNAAVEAATAGEAGKGFAVVAQEVRNLASRSAEAAKEIKDLVEKATLKANDGKNISGLMIDGYQELNQNVENTINLIKDIENASKEQLLGIEQINNAITSLDKQTQENASMASQTNNIANQTSNIAQKILNSVNEKTFIDK